MSSDDLEKSLQFPLGEKYFLVTYHPVTVEPARHLDAVQNLFDAIDLFPDYRVLITKSNSDAGGWEINRKIDEYAAAQGNRVSCHTSLGQRRYLSAMKQASVVVGNSSSGILEAPVMKVPTVNIGTRQQGRLRYPSVIDCGEEKENIAGAIRKALSKEFKSGLADMEIPHADGRISLRIKNILRDTPLNGLFQKHFFDLK